MPSNTDIVMHPESGKFAVLALRVHPVGQARDIELDCGSGFHVVKPWFPVDVSLWRELGGYQLDEIRQSNIWIWAFAPTDRPEVRDGENNHLSARLHAFKRALFLCRPPVIQTAWTLTGVLARPDASQPEVRTLAKDANAFIKEERRRGPALTLTNLRRAAQLAESISGFESDNIIDGRLERGWTSFISAMYSPNLDDAIIFLVRTIESIVQNKDKLQFVNRICAIASNPDEEMREAISRLYDARSGLVHAESLDEIFGDVRRDEAEREGRRFQRIAYLLASCLLTQVFAHRNLVEKFSRERLGDWWGRIVGARGKASPLKLPLLNLLSEADLPP